MLQKQRITLSVRERPGQLPPLEVQEITLRLASLRIGIEPASEIGIEVSIAPALRKVVTFSALALSKQPTSSFGN